MPPSNWMHQALAQQHDQVQVMRLLNSGQMALDQKHKAAQVMQRSSWERLESGKLQADQPQGMCQ
jgi:hypothetical protein